VVAVSDPVSEWAKAVANTSEAVTEVVKGLRDVGRFIAPPLRHLIGMSDVSLSYVLATMQVRFTQRFRKFMAERGLEAPSRPIPFSFSVPLIEHASLEADEELQDIWARMLANAADAGSGTHDPERGETNKIPRKDIACEGLLPCKVSGDWQELKEITSAPFYDRNITISVARDRESLAGLAEIPIRIDAFNLMNPPSTAHELARRYERDEDLVRFIKSVRGSRYQICGATFRKRDGGDYSEIHHLESLADGGLDVSRNMLVVCAHHHRQFHFGEISVIVRTKQEIEVEIDGQRHICALGSI
jgi:hypothetical protein